MFALDFEYDGLKLSDFKFIICDFGGSSGVTTVDAGSKITFAKVARNYGRKYSLVGTKYDECYSCTFDICKDQEIFDGEDRYITDQEWRAMARWLNRKEFLKFRVLPEESTDDPCYFNASFNLQKIKHRERICGITLTMETDAPFGYGEDKNISLDFTAEGSQTVHDTSDEIGETAVDITLTCGEDGPLILTNETLGKVTEIQNCKAGEKITILGQQQIILSDSSSHDIANDFNYEFPKIGNTYDNRDNVLTASAACHIDLHYRPTIKSTP